MSGTNPFRRRNDETSGSVDDYGVTDRAQTQTPISDTDVVKPAKKTVRIISPHSATENERRMSRGLFSPSLEPTGSAQGPLGTAESSGESSPVDPFKVESSDDDGNATEDEYLRRNTLSNAGLLGGASPTSETIPSNRYPLPSESVLGGDQSEAGSGQTERPSKPQYSVDEFKELLLTGRKAPVDSLVSTPFPVHQPSQNLADSSSNTDASSISRQSIFEPLPGFQQDTPRSSHEISPLEDERLQLGQTPFLSNERIKPLTPTSHHGRPMGEIVPQRAGSEIPFARLTADGSALVTPSTILPKRLTDLNKPLPPPPTMQSLTTDVYSMSAEPWSSTRRQEAPAPPLPRRQSQFRPKSSIGCSGSPHTSSELTPNRATDVYQQSPVPTNKLENLSGPKEPPPPPPRRLVPSRGLSESSGTSAFSTTATPTSSSFTDDSMSNVPKQRPPVPPTRNRSSSSAKRPTRMQSQSGSPSMPPAPPPRRRDSSHSSSGPFTLNANQQQLDEERQRGDTATLKISSKNIIADLSTLQKEVDALRGKFQE